MAAKTELLVTGAGLGPLDSVLTGFSDTGSNRLSLVSIHTTFTQLHTSLDCSQ